MTISILAFDERTGAYGGAATTGNLCVGGWVLRGDAESGLSASQGLLPSTLWGTDSLKLMQMGVSSAQAVERISAADPGRDQRQLVALDPEGGTACFTGQAPMQSAGSRTARHVIVAGNLLASETVLDAALESFFTCNEPLDLRLIGVLDAAAEAGGDWRGLMSAALLVVRRDAAPMTLRIDYSPRPLQDLRALHGRVTEHHYADWAAQVPTLADPFRAAPYRPKTTHPTGRARSATPVSPR